jgi:hypothetical protein
LGLGKRQASDSEEISVSGKKRSDREQQAHQALLRRSEAVTAAVRSHEKQLAVQANYEAAQALAVERATKRVQARFQSKFAEAAADYQDAYERVSALPWDPDEWAMLGLPATEGDQSLPRQRVRSAGRRKSVPVAAAADNADNSAEQAKGYDAVHDADSGQTNAPGDSASSATDSNAAHVQTVAAAPSTTPSPSTPASRPRQQSRIPTLSKQSRTEETHRCHRMVMTTRRPLLDKRVGTAVRAGGLSVRGCWD